MNDSGKVPKLHPLAEALAADPSSPSDTVQLVGYVGSSTRKAHIRVYLSLAFDEYVDVPEEACLRYVVVPETELPYGATRLWVDAGAQVIHEVRQATHAEARYLDGAIAAEHLREVDPSAAGTLRRAALDVEITRLGGCVTLRPICIMTAPTVCVTRGPACQLPSRDIPCLLPPVFRRQGVPLRGVAPHFEVTWPYRPALAHGAERAPSGFGAAPSAWPAWDPWSGW